MFPERVLNVLLADNPWLEGENNREWVAKHIPSPFVARRTKIEFGDRVSLVIGPRQAGKSTLLWETLSKLDSPCLYVNCEERSVVEWATSPALFVQGLESLVPAGAAVFFEEVQNLEEAGLFLKGLVDRKTGCRFCATGSSSYELESKTRESLAGRAERHLLLPFCFEELTADVEKPASLAQKKARQVVDNLIFYGGYPAVYLGEKKEALLTSLVESFIIRDASDRFRIKHTAAFRKLLELMASQVGNLCNYSEWAAGLGISTDTVREYAAVLSDAHVVKLVRPYVGGKRAEITGTPKVYFVDNGIRNRLFGGFGQKEVRADKGALMENYVFTELYKNIHPLMDSIRFWRSKAGAEVDFVVEKDGKLIGVEVKSGKTGGKLSRSAHSFIDAYSPKNFWVVSDEPYSGFSKDKTRVDFIAPIELERILGE
jgi:predicted AAA+ superfamily ATPase